MLTHCCWGWLSGHHLSHLAGQCSFGRAETVERVDTRVHQTITNGTGGSEHTTTTNQNPKRENRSNTFDMRFTALFAEVEFSSPTRVDTKNSTPPQRRSAAKGTGRTKSSGIHEYKVQQTTTSNDEPTCGCCWKTDKNTRIRKATQEFAWHVRAR